MEQAFNSTDTGKMDLVVSNLRTNRKGLGNFSTNIFRKRGNGQTVPLIIETDIFPSNGVYEFGDVKKNVTFIVKKDASKCLTSLLSAISHDSFGELVKVIKNSKLDKLPTKLFQNPTLEDCMKPIFGSEDTAWFKLDKHCKIFNDKGEELKKLPKKGYYKARLRVSGFYIGTHGNQNYCCSLRVYVEQIAVRETETEVPQQLVLQLGDFEQFFPQPKDELPKNAPPKKKLKI